jgi:hypothetical protein
MKQFLILVFSLFLSFNINAQLIYNETFEKDTVWPNVRQQFGTPHAFNVVDFQGGKRGRFELRDSDPMTSNGTRAEVLFNTSQKEMWYSFNHYLPSAEYAFDSNGEILNQWHQGGGMSPSLSFRTRSGKYQVQVGNTKDTRKVYDLGIIKYDVWVTWVFHVIHSSGTDGLLEIWQNGVKIFTLNGGNMYSGLEFPRWKLGIYKDDWNYEETTDSKLRVFYVDNVRQGDKTANFDIMNSVPVIVAPPPPPPPVDTPIVDSPIVQNPDTPIVVVPTWGVTHFVLINAGTEKEVMFIEDGQTISLSKLGFTKCNIRAVTTPGTSSVLFKLTGQQTRTFIDNKSPYALQGDDGSGNYYYGTWNPPALGTYTLLAESYSEDNAKGNKGISKKITFTIIK